MCLALNEICSGEIKWVATNIINCLKGRGLYCGNIEIIFSHIPIKIARSLIILIISVCEYWSGNMTDYLPEDLQAISLRVWDPNDHQILHGCVSKHC